MIIARSPLRISLGGGGTDLPSYYERFGGFLIAAAIDKYVYITLHETFVPDFIIKYSKLERVAKVDAIEHPIIREAFKLLHIEGGFLELTSMADIPAGTGLGSSGSFTTALLKALHAHQKNLIPNTEIAEQACEIEINRLKEPVGKQDQYIAALGGITCFNFQKGGRVEASPAKISEETRYNLEDNLVMFFTGYSRSAGSILKDQHEKSKQDDKAMLENLHRTKEIGYASQRALESGDLRGFALLMDEHWQHKRAAAHEQSADQ
jgi:D-glycero-alpha-D-manno-heptose-7-phosphate kinase